MCKIIFSLFLKNKYIFCYYSELQNKNFKIFMFVQHHNFSFKKKMLETILDNNHRYCNWLGRFRFKTIFNVDILYVANSTIEMRFIERVQLK